MKTLSALIIIAVTSIVFYSCTDSLVSSGGTNESYQWQPVDSINTETVQSIYAADENTAYFLTYGRVYKSTNGVRTQMNFNDINFRPAAMDSYNPYYTVVGGNTEFGLITMNNIKILDSNNIISVNLNTLEMYSVSLVKILQRGKIIIAASNKLFLYDNGTVTNYDAPDGDLFYKMAAIGNTIYLTAFSTDSENLYKFENNTLTFLQNSPVERVTMDVDNALIRMETQGIRTAYNAYQGAGWNFFASDSAKRKPFWAAGENLDKIYFLASDSVNAYRVSGVFWDGREIKRDYNYPFEGTEPYGIAMSNMKNKTVYVSKQNTIGKTYIYKGKLVTN